MDNWTVPAVELVRGPKRGTTIIVADAGRRNVAAQVEELLTAGERVIAVDPFYFGESKVMEKDFLFALLLAAVGDRPLGLQAERVGGRRPRWAEAEGGAVTLKAIGPRTSLAALTAAALEPKAIGKVELHGSLGSLKEIIEQNKNVSEMPEMFCFGLLEAFDIKQLAALAGPRPVRFVAASERAKTELAGLKAWYTVLGSEFDPLK